MNRVVTVALFLALLLLTPILTAEKCEKEAFFDMMAQAWEEMSQHNTGELARIREIISSFGLKEGETVLDAGCGTGRLIPFLLKEVGRNGRIYALDCSQEMLLIAKQKQYDGNVSFIKADITEMPLPPESMDRIICFRTFAHIDNKTGALREFFRVLKPSGVVVICNLLGSKELNELHKEIGRAVANDISPSAQEMKRLFLGSNFTPLELLDSESLYLMTASKPHN